MQSHACDSFLGTLSRLSVSKSDCILSQGLRLLGVVIDQLLQLLGSAHLRVLHIPEYPRARRTRSNKSILVPFNVDPKQTQHGASAYLVVLRIYQKAEEYGIDRGLVNVEEECSH